MEATASLWPEIQTAYCWVHRAAHILENHDQKPGQYLESDYQALMREIGEHHTGEKTLVSHAAEYFLKVTESYKSGLFHCYRHEGLPRTNNSLEQLFGSARYSQRRASGRPHATPSMVVRGEVRLIASVVTRTHPPEAVQLPHSQIPAWKELRRRIEFRHQNRRKQSRFRKDTTHYLSQIEDKLLKAALPA